MIKYKTFIIKTFDQVKNDNFDQVKLDQPTPCLTTVLVVFNKCKKILLKI